jgi:VCBS repeat-containing protein
MKQSPTAAQAGGFAIDSNSIDLGSLIKRQARVRPTQSPSTVFAERSAMLMPLLGLAACGGGGAAPSPIGPPAPQASVTITADTAANTAGTAVLTGLTGNSVLSNDTTSSGTLSVTAVAAGTTAGTTGAGTAVTGTLGALTITAAGATTYAPGAGATALRAGATATDVYTYTASNGTTSNSGTLTITVTGVNDAPVADSRTGVGFVQNTPAGGVALGLQVSDPDAGDKLTISLTPNLTNGGQLINNGTVLTNGVAVSLTEAQFEALQVRVGVLGTPQGTFTYTVTDDSGSANAATAPVTVTLSVRPPSIDLTNLGTAGVALTGAAGSGFGTAIAGGGDVNGDGRADVVVGAPTAGNGAIKVYFGTAGPLSATASATISGANAGDRFGASVAVSSSGGTSSINGDARADIIVGAPLEAGGGQLRAGAAYVVFGNSSLPADVATPSTSTVVRINGLDGNQEAFNGSNAAVTSLSDGVGYAVYSPGDINGDGRADYIIGVPGGENGDVTNIVGQTSNDNGFSLVGYGQASFASANLNNGSYAGSSTIGTVIRGGDAAANEYFYGISAVGNFNGGTASEFAFASPTRDIAPTGVRTDNGVVYIESGFAQTGGTFNLSQADFQIVGAASNDRLGTAMAFGDVNGDGFADLIVGAPGSDAGGVDSGAVYIVYGAATNTLVGGLIDLNAITFTNGAGTAGGLNVVRIVGGAAGQGFGASVAFLGDFDGSGATSADFAVGTNGGSGDAYVINGGTASAVGSRSAVTPDGANVTLLDGPAAAGTVVVANVGDVNGGGQADLGVGIGGANAAYVVYAKTASQAPAALSVVDSGVSVDQIVTHYAGSAPASTISFGGTDNLALHTPLSMMDTMHISNAV